MSIRLLDSVANSLYNHPPGFCVLEAACARSLIVEYNGDVYPCDFCVTKENHLGNVHTHACQELMAAPGWTDLLPAWIKRTCRAAGLAL